MSRERMDPVGHSPCQSTIVNVNYRKDDGCLVFNEFVKFEGLMEGRGKGPLLERQSRVRNAVRSKATRWIIAWDNGMQRVCPVRPGNVRS